MKCSEQTRSRASNILGIAFLLAGFLIAATVCAADPAGPSQIPNIFKPDSTPADSIFRLSKLVLVITSIIFVVVFSLIAYATAKFRKSDADDGSEPPQVYGSNQLELAWTVIPVLIVLVLFLATARVIHSVQDAAQAARRHRSHRRRPSVLVGISLSAIRRRHRQRTARSGQRPAASHSNLYHSAFRGHRPQLLGAAPGRQDRPDSEPS